MDESGDGGNTTLGSEDPYDLRIVCPTYLDVDPFLKLREGIRNAVESNPSINPGQLRFTVLDDTAGQDPEMSRIRELDDVDVIEPPFNLGHQRGLVYALREITPDLDDRDVIVTLDSDGEDQPEDVPRLVEKILSLPADSRQLVLARRMKRAHAPLAFRLLYPGFKVFFKLITGTSVESGNFACYRAGTARRILLHPSFALCYSSSLLVMDVPINYVPCERGNRLSGSSRMGYSRLFTHAMRMLMPFSEAIARRALWAFFAMLALALSLTVLVLVIRFGTSEAVPGWATYSLASAAIVSLVAFGNLVILFTVYSQSTAVSMQNLEHNWDLHPRKAGSEAGESS